MDNLANAQVLTHDEEEEMKEAEEQKKIRNIMYSPNSSGGGPGGCGGVQNKYVLWVYFLLQTQSSRRLSLTRTTIFAL